MYPGFFVRMFFKFNNLVTKAKPNCNYPLPIDWSLLERESVIDIFETALEKEVIKQKKTFFKDNFKGAEIPDGDNHYFVKLTNDVMVCLNIYGKTNVRVSRIVCLNGKIYVLSTYSQEKIKAAFTEALKWYNAMSSRMVDEKSQKAAAALLEKNA